MASHVTDIVDVFRTDDGKLVALVKGIHYSFQLPDGTCMGPYISHDGPMITLEDCEPRSVNDIMDAHPVMNLNRDYKRSTP